MIAANILMNKLLPRLNSSTALFFDIFFVSLSWVTSFYIRFNLEVNPEVLSLIWESIFIPLALQPVFFIFFGLYRGLWGFVSINDFKRILVCILFSSLVLLATLHILFPQTLVPRAVLILHPLILILTMTGSRIFYRIIKEHKFISLNALSQEPLVIIGDPITTVSIIKFFSQSEKWSIVGIISKNNSIHLREIGGVKILGSVSDLPKIAKRFALKSVLIISQPSDKVSDKEKIYDLARDLDLAVLFMPSFDDFISSLTKPLKIRNIEIEDLLGRDVVNLDISGVSNLVLNKIVMVSGAGGSIGSELCKQILKFKPSLLICFDLSEHSLYTLEQSLVLNTTKTNTLYIVGDVKNDLKLHDLFSNYKPKLVFHAAAYKHVPLMEHQNVKEAINNNVLGTYSFGKACIKFGVEKFVLISTDKAVNPTSVMGASKRLAEIVCHKLQSKNGTKFSIVRFGNVLGSSGSVIPKFREQIAKGGPITVTHPDISRYFMSIPEACQLILQASLLTQKGKETFLLDMGESIKILSLAKRMISLSGFSENEIHIKFTGLRPGEKLFEELVAKNEKCKPTKHQKIQLIESINFNNKNIGELISWIKTIQKLNEIAIKKELINWVDGYHPDLSVEND